MDYGTIAMAVISEAVNAKMSRFVLRDNIRYWKYLSLLGLDFSHYLCC